ncbi:MAG: hypothetical protein PVJ61_06110 [Dehalococcoidia bacterium]|jgi:hypothetical protein
MSGEDISEIMRVLKDLERRISVLEGMPEKSKSEGKKLSVKEFLLTKNPADDVQRTLVIGYYLENFEGVEAFNVKDLTEGFRLARERVPLNMNDKVNLNIAKGYLMPAKEKKDKFKAWVLTNSGERFVEGGLKTEG